MLLLQQKWKAWWSLFVARLKAPVPVVAYQTAAEDSSLVLKMLAFAMHAGGHCTDPSLSVGTISAFLHITATSCVVDSPRAQRVHARQVGEAVQYILSRRMARRIRLTSQSVNS